MSDPRAETDALYAAWLAAFQDRNVDAILDLLTDDYVLWAPARPPLDAAALRPQLLAAFRAYHIEPRFEREEQLIAGDLAVERGWDCQTLRSRTDGVTQSQRQRVFVVLRRSPDGRWRFARGMSQPGPAA
jgi:ketosteroid isomerase-like protein